MFHYLALAAVAVVGGIIAAVVTAEGSAKPKSSGQAPAEDPALDLKTNWGVTPQLVREWAARAEVVAQQLGLARALAVAWWTVRQRGQPFLSPAEAAELAAKDPDLCRLCFDSAQAALSAAELAKRMKAGWPKPTDLAGWQSGAGGLGGQLGAVAVYAGSEDALLNGAVVRARLPLISLPAAEAMARWDVQAWLVTALIWRYMAPKYKALDADSVNAWANLFSAFLDPIAYDNGKGLDAKQEYMQRSTELGIDLAQLPHPGTKQGGTRPWRAWQAMQAIKDRPVIDLSAVDEAPPQPPKEPKPAPQPAPLPGFTLSINLPHGYVGRSLPSNIPDVGAPLVVLLHGPDSDENQLASLVPATMPARVFALRGPLKATKGFSLMDVDLLSPAAVAAINTATAQATDAVRKLLEKFPSSRVFVAGYDQGAALALRMAALGLVDGAVAVGGYLPEALLPARSSGVQSVRLIHGQNDGIISLVNATKVADAYSAAGIPVALDVVPGTDHVLSPALMATAFAALGAQVAAPLPAAIGFHWTDDCKFFIDDVAVAQRFVVPRVAGSVTPGAQIGPIVRGVLTSGAPEKCKAAKTDPIDATYAVRFYDVARALLQTLALRGLVPVDEAKLALADTAKLPEKFGVPAADLPELEV